MTKKIYNIQSMDRIRILTTDGRLMNLLRIGDNTIDGSDKITWRTGPALAWKVAIMCHFE